MGSLGRSAQSEGNLAYEDWEVLVTGQAEIEDIWSHSFRTKTLETWRTSESKIVQTVERN